MRRVMVLVSTCLVVAALTPLGGAAATPAEERDGPAGSYIVTLRAGEPGAVAREHARGHQADVAHVYRHALRGYAARMSARAAARIARDDRVAAVEADRLVEATHHCPFPGHPHCPDDGPEEPDPEPSDYRVPTGVQRIFWEDSSAVAADGTVVPVDAAVAVLDTGISTHGDLTVAGGYNCSNGPTSNWSDGHGHGTHVAGTVGAHGEIVGVAPGAPLWAVRVLDNSGRGTWSSVICGVDWVTANADAVDVANMSLGGSGSAGDSCSASALRQAICNSVAAGVTYVVAAGNDADDVSDFVPAAYPEVITVGALADFDGQPGGAGSPTCRDDVDDTWANFSNYSEADGGVDLAAPGVCIESTWNDGGYRTISGTSMASPHAAGAAALYLDRSGGGSPQDVRTALTGAGNLDYSYTWDGSTSVPGPKPPLLDVGDF